MHANPAYSHVTVVSIGYLIAVLILTTNGILLIGLLCDRLSRQSTLGLYVINMCVANFLYGCLTIVQYLPSSMATSMGLNHDTCVYIAATLELLPAVTVLTLLVLLVGQLHFLLSGGYEVMKENLRMRCIFGLIGVWFTWILATLVVMPLRMSDGTAPLTPSRALPGHGLTYYGGSQAGLMGHDIATDSMHGFSALEGNDVETIETTRFIGAGALVENPAVVNSSTASEGSRGLYRTLKTTAQHPGDTSVGNETKKGPWRDHETRARHKRSIPRRDDRNLRHRHEVDIEDEVNHAFTYGYAPSHDVFLPASPSHLEQEAGGGDGKTGKDTSKLGDGTLIKGDDITGEVPGAVDKTLSQGSPSGGSKEESQDDGGVGICSRDLLPSHPRKAAVSLVTVFPPTLALLCLSLALLALLFCSPDPAHPRHAKPKRRRPSNQSALRWAGLNEDVKREVVVLVAVCVASVALRLPREVARLVESVASGGGGGSQRLAMPPYLVLLEMLNSCHAVVQPVLWLALLPAAKRALRGLCCRGGHQAPERERPLRALPLETSV